MTARIAICIALAALCVLTGWQARGWKEDSESLAVERAAQKIVEKATANESGIASKVEERLAGLTANQTVIDRGIIREIQKPIYQRVCLEPDAIRLLNAAARGEAPDAAGKPSGKVP